MTNTTSPFISELIRAANEVDRLTMRERAKLLSRAAATIRDYRDEINISGAPANDDDPDDIVHCLREMAKAIEDFPANEVGEAMLEAVDIIKTCRVLLEAKREIEAGKP